MSGMDVVSRPGSPARTLPLIAGFFFVMADDQIQNTSVLN